jgi:glycine hydroxymethyltransferase
MTQPGTAAVLAPANPTLGMGLAAADPQVYRAITAEWSRQESTLEMIASENFAPQSVMEAQGSVLTNKYAEGYPGRRYYGGCEHVDVIEQLAIDRVKDLFGASYANVQPHSGAQANAAAMSALLQPGDTMLGQALDHGGHLTHGMRLNFSGKLYDVAAYHVREDDHLIDMDEVERLARTHRPKLIMAGWSAYPRHVDFAAFRRIADDVGAYLMVDMAHFAGLVAAGLHPTPVPYAHVVTSTTHKTLGGPRGGIILTNDEALAKKINSAVFPGQQGGPLEHVIAAKAVSFKFAAEPEFRERQQRTLEGAKIIADRLLRADSREAGVSVVSGGTDVHLVLVDLRASELDGKQAEDRLHRVGITVNRNAVPFDPRPPMVSSGVRIGTSALATRGFDAEAFAEVADIIGNALRPDTDETRLDELRARVDAPALICPTTRTSSGTTPSRSPPTTSSSSAAVATAWRPRTIWRRTTASRTSRCWRRVGWPAATWPATPPSSGRTICGTRAPRSTSTPSNCGKASRTTSVTRSYSASAACSTWRTPCRTCATACDG